MKRTIYFSLIFLFFSCSKHKNQMINFSLLDKYNWQSIETHDVKNIFDSANNITYSDTCFYSFDGANFTTRYQATTIGFTIGTDGNSYTLNQVTGTWTGHYQINEKDSTITFSGSRILTVYDQMSPPGSGRDSVFTETTSAKVLVLNTSILKMNIGQKDPVYLKIGSDYLKVQDSPDYPVIGGETLTCHSIQK